MPLSLSFGRIIECTISVDPETRLPSSARVSYTLQDENGNEFGPRSYETFDLVQSNASDLMDLTADDDGVMRDAEGKALFVSDSLAEALSPFYDMVRAGLKHRHPDI